MYFVSRRTIQDMFTTSLRRWAQRVVLQNFFSHSKQPNSLEISIPRVTSPNHLEAGNNPTRVRDFNLNNTMYRRSNSHQKTRRRIEENIPFSALIVMESCYRENWMRDRTDCLLWPVSYIFVSKTDFLESSIHNEHYLLLFNHDYLNLDQDTQAT